MLEILHPFVVYWHLGQEAAAAEDDLVKKKKLADRMNAKNAPLEELKRCALSLDRSRAC